MKTMTRMTMAAVGAGLGAKFGGETGAILGAGPGQAIPSLTGVVAASRALRPLPGPTGLAPLLCGVAGQQVPNERDRLPAALLGVRR
jgi:hypothetical protein